METQADETVYIWES